MVDSSSPSRPKWSLLFFCGRNHANVSNKCRTDPDQLTSCFSCFCWASESIPSLPAGDRDGSGEDRSQSQRRFFTFFRMMSMYPAMS